MKITMIFLGLMLAIVLIGCGGEDSQEEFGDTIAIPGGFEFVAASAHGKFSNNLTIYILDQDSERIFQYQDGKIGSEVIIPDGYTLVGASAYGKFSNNLTLYCTENETNKIIKC